MDSEKITLYDSFTAHKSKIFSPFVMRARIVMNLKKVPFETVLVPFPQIEEKAKELGADFSRIAADGKPLYTVPFICVESSNGSKRFITDSLKIAQYFDAKETDPSQRLFSDDTRVLHAVWDQWLREKVAMKLLRVFLPSLIEAFDPSERQYIMESRKRALGVPWEAVAPQTPEALEEAWKGAEEALTAFAALIDATEGKGSHRISPRPTWHEIQFISLLRSYKAFACDDPNAWPRMAKLNGGRWAKLLEEPEYDNYESVYLNLNQPSV